MLDLLKKIYELDTHIFMSYTGPSHLDEMLIAANAIPVEDLPLFINKLFGVPKEIGLKPRYWPAIIYKRLALGGALVRAGFDRDSNFTVQYWREP